MDWTYFFVIGTLTFASLLALNWCWALSKRNLEVWNELIECQKHITSIYRKMDKTYKNSPRSK